MDIRKALLFILLLSGSCTSNSRLTQSQFYSPQAANLNMSFPGEVKSGLEYDQFGKRTTKTYQRFIDQIAPNQRDKILFYSHIIDLPHDTPYTAFGKIIRDIDTTNLKNNGFVNRTVNNQPYLHKRFVDRSRKLISSEFVVKVDNGFFYLFSYAPIRHLLPNEEDVIIAQDSLNRKHAAVIGSFKNK